MLGRPLNALTAAAIVLTLVAGGCGSGKSASKSSAARTSIPTVSTASAVKTTTKPPRVAHRPSMHQRRRGEPHLVPVAKPLHRIPPPTGGAALAKQDRTKAQLRALGSPGG